MEYESAQQENYAFVATHGGKLHMLTRLIRTGMTALVVTALAGTGAAWAQDDFDPCPEGEPCAEGEVGGEAGVEVGGEAGVEVGGEAGAEVGAEGAGEAGEVAAAAARGPTLPAGQIAITASLQLGLSNEQGLAPISIAPDVWYGVNDKLQAGLVTSIHGIFGFWSGALLGLAPSGLCLSGEPDLAEGQIAGCDNVFDNIGAEALYAVSADGPFQLAAGGGLHAFGFDPFQLTLKAGVRGMYRSGQIAVGFAPNVYIGLTEREEAGNKEAIAVPVDVTFMASPQLGVGVQTGIFGSFDGFGDNYVVPLAVGAMYMINPQMVVAGAFSLDRVIGFEGPDAFDLRSINISFGYML